MHVDPLGQLYRVGEDGFEHRQSAVALDAQTVAGACEADTYHRTDRTAFDLVGSGEFFARVDTDLTDLFVVGISVAFENIPYSQPAAGDLHPCQPAALSIFRDLVDTSGKFTTVVFFGGIADEQS